MAKFDKIAVLDKIGSTGMVPVFYHKDAEVAKKVVKACYDGGVRAFEFTNRGDFAQEVFAAPFKWGMSNSTASKSASLCMRSRIPRLWTICPRVFSLRSIKSGFRSIFINLPFDGIR